ncbi:MAG TPA: BNR-4 repeat-containing protein [Candidatus Hydrogenedens sp.]|nr:BNR-4 repeat-containing protein [Candidatus Hydrogenedens sp.]HOL20399.1 BNR-4 repeat-containing protein [Candidatus Hydrogenedens sp.]HPP58904.1 BNR-4 repeat-containing protein [Candidatus Hydrogenedens sp.]
MKCILKSIFLLFLHLSIIGYTDVIIGNSYILSQSGAYCWFQDPRAVFVEGKFLRTYVGWVTADGKLQVGYYDHKSREIKVYTIREDWDIDDHNVPSFLVLPDLRLMIFYAKHNKENLYARRTLRPEDISEWESEIIVSNMSKVTYSHPVFLAKENRYYVFWRGESWKPTFATSVDGIHWSEPNILFQDKGKESKDIRPYLKVVSDNKKTIHFAFTDGHPRNEPLNSVYYAFYKEGSLYRANGEKIGAMDNLPVPHSACDRVYDAKTTGARAWVWDIALNKKGNPVIVYTRLPEETKHYYHYAFWNGTQWEDHEITLAGPWFPETPTGKKETEPHYSGGISLNHANPNEVYLSRKVGEFFEIERWRTEDGGKTWTTKSITTNSSCINVRPIVPWGYNKEVSHIIWMRGHYKSYTQFNTAIVCWFDE